eukprot:750872-Hanusia_phi.AAC.5
MQHLVGQLRKLLGMQIPPNVRALVDHEAALPAWQVHGLPVAAAPTPLRPPPLSFALSSPKLPPPPRHAPSPAASLLCFGSSFIQASWSTYYSLHSLPPSRLLLLKADKRGSSTHFGEP